MNLKKYSVLMNRQIARVLENIIERSFGRTDYERSTDHDVASWALRLGQARGLFPPHHTPPHRAPTMPHDEEEHHARPRSTVSRKSSMASRNSLLIKKNTCALTEPRARTTRSLALPSQPCGSSGHQTCLSTGSRRGSASQRTSSPTLVSSPRSPKTSTGAYQPLDTAEGIADSRYALFSAVY